MFGRHKIASALIASLLTGLVALQAPSVSPVAANGTTLGWQAVGGGLSGASGSRVFQLVRGSDGTLFAGGTFTGAVVSLASTSASTWQTLSGGPTQKVYSLGLDEQSNPSRLYVGGDFTTNGGGLARVTPSNGTWTSLGSSGLYEGDGVERMTILSPTEVYIGGSFDDANLVSNTEGLARLNNTTFTAVAGGISGSLPSAAIVNALATHGGLLYVGGQFDAVSGSAVVGSRIAVFNPTTSAWSAFGAPTSGPYRSSNNNPIVAAIAVQATNSVFIGGNFEGVRNSNTSVPETKGIAKWDGSAWRSVGQITGTVIEELRIVGNYLYAGGEFTAINGVTANNIARMNLSTNQWEPLVQGCINGVNGVVRSIIDAGDGTSVYVGGGFTDVAGIADADRVAKYTPGASTFCPSAETAPVLAFDGPKNFRFTNFGMVGKLPGYNNGQEGRLIEFAWDAPTGVDYYIYKVSGVKITKKDDRGRILESEPLPSYDCWSVGLTCAIVVSKDDPYYQDNQNFVFTLRGFTFSGVGKPSYLYYLSAYDPIYPADPPTNVQAVAGWNQVKVSWDPPAYTGTYQITNYLVTATPGNRVCITTLADVKLTECTFTSLTPGTRYTFKVQALNGAGWSDRSQASTTPVSPQNVKITKVARNRARFLFVNRGSDIVAEGLAPGYPAGTTLTAWARYGDSTQWQPLGDVKISAFGTFSWKRRFPTNQDRTPIFITFTQGNYQSNSVRLAAIR